MSTPSLGSPILSGNIYSINTGISLTADLREKGRQVLLVLNTLFKGRVIIARNTFYKFSSRLLTKDEATNYIEKLFPEKLFQRVINKDIYAVSPAEILKYYEAYDQTSCFDIRFPKTSAEAPEAIVVIEKIIFYNELYLEFNAAQAQFNPLPSTNKLYMYPPLIFTDNTDRPPDAPVSINYDQTKTN
jgi:hypothetical protein